MESQDNKQYQCELHPSMKRRCNMHDYNAPGIYMFTLIVNERKRLLGTLAVKRLMPLLFKKYLHIVIGNREYAAYGNIK